MTILLGERAAPWPPTGASVIPPKRAAPPRVVDESSRFGDNGTVRVVSVQLLGRVGVTIDGQPLDLRGAMPPALVGRLALAAGDPVPLEQLIPDLWPDPPSAAAVTVRSNVSRLRAAGLADVIEGGRRGYAFTGQVEVDAAAFTATAEHALATGALADLERADAGFSGTPLRGIDAPYAAPARAALQDLHRRVAEALAGARLEAGEVEAVIAALPGVVASHPLHEAPARLLATALARAGRTSEALETLDAHTQRIADEQGLDPSPAIDALRMSIVRHDPDVLPQTLQQGDGSPRRHGVPLPITRFVGRARELDLIRRARLESRLTTITGPGGVGKSRLAIEAVRQGSGLADGEQWLLELAPIVDGRDVLIALGELVGAANPTAPSIAEQLSGTGTLLVLDNAEHLLADVAELASALLASSPGLTVLVTSREPLRVPGERLIPVGTMLDDDASDAASLFAARAADAVPGFALDDTILPQVRRLVRMLDGLPLAIELAAARLDVMDLPDLARSLEEGELLTLGGEAAGRHGSLQNTIDWSARLLDADERQLLAQLSGFAGPVSLSAIEGICVTEGSASVREVATVLAQKSLLTVEGATTSGRRYRLLESVKLYAQTLPRTDDPIEWRDRHAHYLADCVDDLEPDIRGPKSSSVHVDLDTYRPDLQAATGWAIERGERELALRLVGGQAWHWFIRGAVNDGRRTLDAALELPGDASPYFEARAIWGALMIIYRSGDKFAGEAYAARGLPLARRAGDPTQLALFLACNAMWVAGRDAAAGARLMAEAEAVLARGIAPWAESELLTFRSVIHHEARKPALAMRDLQAAIVSARRAHNDWSAASASWRLAGELINQRRYGDALAELNACLDLLALQSDILAVVLVLHAGAIAVAGLERQVDAARLFGAVDRLGASYGFPRGAVNDDAHERHRTRAKQSLTAAQWNVAYRDGTKLSLDEAIRLLRTLAR
jgi:predicted ATPase/DNA-binding SARP family transcriptional activator